MTTAQARPREELGTVHDGDVVARADGLSKIYGSGDSALLDYRPYCSSVTHCATAADLERTLDEVLATYH